MPPLRVLWLLPLVAAVALTFTADRAYERTSWSCGGQTTHRVSQLFGITLSQRDSAQPCAGGSGQSRWGWPYASRRQRLEDFPLPLGQQGAKWQSGGLLADFLVWLVIVLALLAVAAGLGLVVLGRRTRSAEDET